MAQGLAREEKTPNFWCVFFSNHLILIFMVDVLCLIFCFGFGPPFFWCIFSNIFFLSLLFLFYWSLVLPLCALLDAVVTMMMLMLMMMKMMKMRMMTFSLVQIIERNVQNPLLPIFIEYHPMSITGMGSIGSTWSWSSMHVPLAAGVSVARHLHSSNLT